MATITLGASDDILTHAEAHLLPCRVELDGVSDVSLYFTPQDAASEGGAKKAAFRGRELKGEVLEIGEHYDACIVKSSPDGRWVSAEGLAQFTHWSRDTDPATQTVGTKKLLNDWPVLASELARPVTTEELEAELAAMKPGGSASAASKPDQA
eukprot:TRINITY_DN58518_c0_g1_i1.p1 TRINITY_DN58518_c0_g1~~TRINITY_DN58518_c0_g1_i1.p1  ORF type:complete len:161 (+),score=52.56 TRINITY_DN58518_c0_g1_i1:26-484(+)